MKITKKQLRKIDEKCYKLVLKFQNEYDYNINENDAFIQGYQEAIRVIKKQLKKSKKQKSAVIPKSPIFMDMDRQIEEFFGSIKL